MILPGSYANGFAPRDGQPLYPDLWRGCVGAWAPCLGPTGVTLRDWSGRHNHGTLTNMDTAGDWVPNQGRYALDFDGTDDYVDCGLGTAATLGTTTSFAVSLWANIRASANDGIFYIGNFASSAGVFQFSTASNFFVLRLNGGAYDKVIAFPSWVNSAWAHFAISYNGANVALFRNGVAVPDFSGAFTQSLGFTGNRTIIAAYFSSGFTANAILDDVRVYNRALLPQQISLLTSRRGIAYELAPRLRSRIFAGGFKAYWAARKAQIIGGGL